MNQQTYTINYGSMPPVERASRKTMATYLNAEKAAWSPFLETLPGLGDRIQIQVYQSNFAWAEVIDSFAKLENALGDMNAFSAMSVTGFRRQLLLPPPSDSVEGCLIIGLHAAGRHDDARAAFTWFVRSELGSNGNARITGEQANNLLQRGDMLLAAAHAAAVLPPQKILPDGLHKACDTARVNLKALDQAVAEAEQVNNAHDSALAEMRAQLTRQAVKLRGIFVRAERRRSRRYQHWTGQIDVEVARRFEAAETRLAALDRLEGQKQQARVEAFEELKALFYTQLRLRAPVALWEQRALLHGKLARRAMWYFWAAAGAAVLVGLVVPWWAGTYIAESFNSIRCLPSQPKNCSFVFSAKGPLTVAGVLLTTSLILWVTRMQYRIFLSERHLSLDADERRAFAETYMALKEDTAVDSANETIVLASLFRPTQDGIIKDEDNGFDLSAAALIAKQFAK